MEPDSCRAGEQQTTDTDVLSLTRSTKISSTALYWEIFTYMTAADRSANISSCECDAINEKLKKFQVCALAAPELLDRHFKAES